MAAEPLGSPEVIRQALTALDGLDADIQGSLNYPELAKHAFRDIARVAGLVQQGAVWVFVVRRTDPLASLHRNV